MPTSYKDIIQKVNDAFATGKTDAFLDLCSEDVKWTIVGDQVIEGKDALKTFLSAMNGEEPPRFTMDAFIADENSAMARGSMTMIEKEGCEGTYEYCDIYTFNGDGEISELRTFIVKVS